MTAALALRRCPVCGATYEDPRLAFCRVDGAALSASSGDPLIGTVVAGRYRVQEPLGEGGMGSVYVAEHLVMQRQVALKIVRPELADDPVIAKRFVREARIVSALQSPHIVQTLDCGAADDGRLFLAMERLVGGTLRERIAEGRLPLGEAVRVTTAVLEGLRVAHAAGVVHRDLKPDNVFVCDGGEVKVLDFGIARIFESSAEQQGPSLTATSAIIGTALYMSPEAVSRSAVEPPADIYALGVMLFEMLTGEPPFYDDEPVLLMGMHLRVPPPTLASATGRSWPAKLEGLLAAMLEKEPGDRPSIDEIGVTLSEALSGGEPEPAEEKRRPWLWLVAGLAMLGGLGTASAWVAFGSGDAPEPPSPVATHEAVTATPPVGTPPVETPPVETPPAETPSAETPSAETPSAETAEPPAAEPDPGAPSAVEPVAVMSTVEFAADLTPLSTRVTLDGESVQLPTTLSADGSRHELVFSAEGYREVRRTVVADSDEHFVIALERVRRAVVRRAPPVIAARPVARPLAVPTAPVRPAPAPVRPAPVPARRTGGGMTTSYGL